MIKHVIPVCVLIGLSYSQGGGYALDFDGTNDYVTMGDALVNITIYDMMGRQIRTLINNQQTAGYKSIFWNATNDNGSPVSAGLYLYTIQAGEFRQTKKMVLLK